MKKYVAFAGNNQWSKITTLDDARAWARKNVLCTRQEVKIAEVIETAFFTEPPVDFKNFVAEPAPNGHDKPAAFRAELIDY